MIELFLFQDREGSWRVSINGVREENVAGETPEEVLRWASYTIERRRAEDRLVSKLTAAMREKLAVAANRAKGEWSKVSPHALHGRAHEELLELLQAINSGDPEAAMREAADVACFAAMAAENTGRAATAPVVERPVRAEEGT